MVGGMTRTSRFTPIASGSGHCTSRVRLGSKRRLRETDQECWSSCAPWAVFLDRKNSCTKKPMAAETPEPSSVTRTERSEWEEADPEFLAGAVAEPLFTRDSPLC